MPYIAASVIVLLSLCVWIYWAYYQTYHFAVVQPGVLFRDGLQGLRRFRNAHRRYGFKTVINIQATSEISGKYRSQVDAEKQFCAENGLKFVHIDMPTKTAPTEEQIVQFLAIADDPANQPVLVHDSQGVIREGMLVGLWQIERMGFSSEQALQAIRLYGHNPKRAKSLFEFLGAYKPHHPKKEDGR